jgi:AraC-like DNA-binding protein
MQSGHVALMTRTQLVRPALLLVRERGGDPATWIERFGLPVTAEQDGESHVRLRLLHALLDAIASELDEPLLGLRLPAYMSRSTHGVMSYLWSTAATVGDALHLVTRFMPLINEVVTASITYDGDRVMLDHAVPGEPLCLGAHANECWLAVTLAGLRTLGVEPVDPLRVWVAHPSRGTDRAFAAALGGGTVEYGRGSNGFAIPTHALALPIPTADALLHDVVRARAEDELRQRDGCTRFLGMVRQVLRDELELGLPTVATTARRMRVAPRTLQRRLHEEGTSFHDLLESVRCEIACDRLRRDGRKIMDVAGELQYADESAFVRAFKRWQGVTPGVYRKQFTGAPEAAAWPDHTQRPQSI